METKYKLNGEWIWIKIICGRNRIRPQLERKNLLNLNGLWSYSITDLNALNPRNLNEKILVPFPLESSLSRVMKSLNENQILWNYKEFEIPENWKM